MIRGFLLGCAVAALSAPVAGALERSHFELKNVADFVALCDPPQSDQERWYGIVFCRGYIRGLGDFNRAFFRRGALSFCLPTQPPTVEAVSVAYVAWARQSPGELAKPDIIESMLRWASHTYPCQRPAR